MLTNALPVIWHLTTVTTITIVTLMQTAQTPRARFTAPVIRDIQETGSCVLVSKFIFQVQFSFCYFCLLDLIFLQSPDAVVCKIQI